MSTYFYKQLWAFPEGVVKGRAKAGGDIFSMGSLLDPNEQTPIIASRAQATRPIFVLGKDGYVAVRGKFQMPEDEGMDNPTVV